MKFAAGEYTKSEILRLVGGIDQIAGMEKAVLDDGRGRGMRAVTVHTGAGLRFTVLPDRGMDIGRTSFRELPLSFLSRGGYASPALWEEPDMGFHKSFAGGMLVTCGLSYFGGPCTDEGERLGLHGRATAIPAGNTRAWGEWRGDDYVMTVAGDVLQEQFEGDSLKLHREITALAGENRFSVRDTVENTGYRPQPVMVLYHVNFGYPFVSPDSVLTHSAGETEPKNAEAAAGIENHTRFEVPDESFTPQVFYHHLQPDGNGFAYARLENPKIGAAAYIKYKTENLPLLVQWKHLVPGEYICGLEPAMWYGHGRDEARRRGELRLLSPGETVEFQLEIGAEALETKGG